MLREAGEKDGLLGKSLLKDGAQGGKVMRIAVPQAVEQIIETLTCHGYEAYAVGGCVRDSLLGREPGDWDITTSASPYQVKELFRRTIDTGILHGTVTVMKNHVGYEVTTYRVDGEYEDGRHPKSVEFTSDLREDLCRRDFTINAMAYSHETGIVDIFGGVKDLQMGIIRCVGNPLDRFHEDALRILRAMRFSAQLGFEIEETTRTAIEEIAPNLEKVSKERIQVELTKLLCSSHPEQITDVYAMGASPFVSLAFHEIDHSQVCIPSILPAKKHIRWAAFLKDTSREKAVQVLKDLKMDNATISRIQTLHPWILFPIRADKAELRRVMSQMEPEWFDDLLVLREAMELGQTVFAPGEITEKIVKPAKAGTLKQMAAEIREAGDCTCLKDLAVTGKDLLAYGMKPGKQIGETLSGLLDYVLSHPEENQKEQLLKLVKDRY